MTPHFDPTIRVLPQASLNPNGNHFSQNQIDKENLKIFLQSFHRRKQILIGEKWSPAHRLHSQKIANVDTGSSYCHLFLTFSILEVIVHLNDFEIVNNIELELDQNSSGGLELLKTHFQQDDELQHGIFKSSFEG
jgi:hypothetical protein